MPADRDKRIYRLHDGCCADMMLSNALAVRVVFLRVEGLNEVDESKEQECQGAAHSDFQKNNVNTHEPELLMIQKTNSEQKCTYQL